MPKPTPKREIVVQHKDESIPRLMIYAATSDAAGWIEREAPQFGRLYPPINTNWPYELWVLPTYDFDEVKAYIERGGE